MNGTRDAIVKEIERQVKNVNGHDVAASIATRLLNQDQYHCSSTAHDLPMLLPGALSPVVLPACTLQYTNMCNIYDYREDVQHTIELMKTKYM